MPRVIALSLLALFLSGTAQSSPVQAATPRAIVSGQEPPSGVTVLDHDSAPEQVEDEQQHQHRNHAQSDNNAINRTGERPAAR